MSYVDMSNINRFQYIYNFLKILGLAKQKEQNILILLCCQIESSTVSAIISLKLYTQWLQLHSCDNKKTEQNSISLNEHYYHMFVFLGKF